LKLAKIAEEEKRIRAELDAERKKKAQLVRSSLVD